jgi:hypothetical protein
MFHRSSMKGHMYSHDASPAVPGRHVRFDTSSGGTPGFPGSPLRNLADAFENEALQISQTEHLSTLCKGR